MTGAPNGGWDGLMAVSPEPEPEPRGDGTTFFGLTDEQLDALAAAEHHHHHRSHKS